MPDHKELDSVTSVIRTEVIGGIGYRLTLIGQWCEFRFAFRLEYVGADNLLEGFPTDNFATQLT
jgi:hypothetical protein